MCVLLVSVDDYIAQFERKITFWTEMKTTLTDEEALRLGFKDAEESVAARFVNHTSPGRLLACRIL